MGLAGHRVRQGGIRRARREGQARAVSLGVR
jgi:hypothetical protein